MVDEIDELDAYMASLEKQQEQDEILDGRKAKRARIEPASNFSDDSDDGLNVEDPADNGPEDLEADLAATIANSNACVNKTTKKLNQLSKKDVVYLPFRKDFYVEVPELANLTEEEVKELRLSLENIKVVGKSCPKPATCWAHCGLSRKVMEVLKKSKYLSPTPIQAQAIPAIMSGRDVIGIAKTGCGKTLSFLLPMFRHILDQPKLEKGDGPIAVIITPTRELATQICDDALKFTKSLNLRIIPVYGGPNISKQIGMLKPGAEIVVCTPGRMIEILTVNGGRVTNLNRCTFLVLDEADRLFDMGFEKQIRSIVDLIRSDRQTVMFSATFPKIMEAHARRILTKPIEIQVGGRSVVCKDVHQTIELIEEHDKFLRLLPILQKHVDKQSKAIVFVSKQEKADSLLEDLMQAYDPNCLVLHGGIDKDDRISTFASFKSGTTKVLVATSIAARGLDVKDCICVVNYDVPNHYEDYVHRCGRTGRAGNKGFAYTFITPDQGQYACDIIKALELSENSVPVELQKLWDDYKIEAEKTGKKIWVSSGFAGKGFKFDEAEAQLLNEKKLYQKKSLGLINSDDEDDEEQSETSKTEQDTETLKSEVESLASMKSKTVESFDKKATNNLKQTVANSSKQMTNTKQEAVAKEGDNKILTKLDLIRQRAALLMEQKRIEPIETASNLLPLNITPTTIATNLIMTTTTTTATTTATAIPANSSSSAPTGNQRMEQKFEINDYHQQVRRKLTSKEALAKISEECQVGITVRGKFCPVGDQPLQPKLYLAIEGTSKSSLEKANRELLLLVKNEYTKLYSQPATRGRYKLL